MSQELKTKFTADASDFNAAVKGIDGKLKGVGKLGQGLGLGRVGNGVGDFLQGIGGLGLAGGGIAGGALALVAGFKNIGKTLDDRTKALEAGMPVAELTGFGEGFQDFRDKLGVMGRAFSGLGVLLTQGLDAYSDHVLDGPEAAARRFAEAQEKAALALAELEKTVKYEINQDEAISKARERIAAERRTDARGTVDSVNKGIAEVDDIIGGYSRDNQISAAEKSGDKFGAEVMRITDALNKSLGSQIYTEADVAQIMGDDIRARVAMNGDRNGDRISESVQSSPELTDRLRRIGADGGDFPSQTTQVFREMKNVEVQQLDVLKRIEQKGGSDLTLR